MQEAPPPDFFRPDHDADRRDAVLSSPGDILQRRQAIETPLGDKIIPEDRWIHAHPMCPTAEGGALMLDAQFLAPIARQIQSGQLTPGQMTDFGDEVFYRLAQHYGYELADVSYRQEDDMWDLFARYFGPTMANRLFVDVPATLASDSFEVNNSLATAAMAFATKSPHKKLNARHDEPNLSFSRSFFEQCLLLLRNKDVPCKDGTNILTNFFPAFFYAATDNNPGALVRDTQQSIYGLGLSLPMTHEPDYPYVRKQGWDYPFPISMESHFPSWAGDHFMRRFSTNRNIGGYSLVLYTSPNKPENPPDGHRQLRHHPLLNRKTGDQVETRSAGQ